MTSLCIAARACVIGFLLLALVPTNEVRGQSGQTGGRDTVGGRVRHIDAAKVRAMGRTAMEERTSMTQKVTERDYATRGMVGIGDVMNRMAGVTMKDYGGAGGMKTVSVRGLDATHTSVSYDGIPLTEARTGQIDLNRFDLNQLGSIALRVADGMDLNTPARMQAASATLELTTPRYETGRVTLEQGSFGRYGLSAGYGGEIGRALRLSGYASYLYSENDYPFTLINGTTSERHHRSNSRTQTGKAELNMSGGDGRTNRLDAKLYYSNDSWRLPGVVVFYNPANGEREADQYVTAQGRWKRMWQSGFTMQLLGKLGFLEQKYEDRKDVYGEGKLCENYWQREAYVSGSLSYDKGGLLSGAYSADYMYNTLSASGQTMQRGAERHSLWQSVTGQLRYGRIRVVGRLLGSLFHERVKVGETSANRFRLSPSANASWRVLTDESLYLKVFYKEIFRLPTFSENYYEHVGMSNLSAEKTRQIGGGMVWWHRVASWWPELKVSVDVYTNRVTDKIVSIPITLHTWRTINMGKVRADGLDMALGSRMKIDDKSQLHLNATLTLQSVKDKTQEGSLTYDKQLAYLPETAGSVGLAWTNPWINLSLNGIGASCRYGTGEHTAGTRLEGYGEMGATLWHDFTIRRKRLTAKLDLQNLFDKQYEQINGYPMPGRSYRISINYQL